MNNARKPILTTLAFLLALILPVAALAHTHSDTAISIKEWRSLAEQGDGTAQYNLGVSYDLGLGVPQDFAEAVHWYRKAAELGSSDAQYNLGLSYELGLGVPKDYVEAHKWFNLASFKGDADGAKNRDLIASMMTSAQIAEAQKLAREWRPKK